MIPFWGAIAAALGGSLLGATLACIPGLHLLLVISAAVLALETLGADLFCISAPLSISLCMGLTAGHVMANSLPATMISAPDESKAFAAEAMYRMHRAGRGSDAVRWTAAGVLMGAAILLLIAGPLGTCAFPALIHLAYPLTPWMAGGMIALVLLSGIGRTQREWPHAQRQGRRVRSGIFLGLFLMAGLLGLVIAHTAPLNPLGMARRFVPAILGLYTVPGLLACIPRPHTQGFRRALPATATSRPDLLSAVLAGIWSGGLALSAPGMSSATGGFLCRQLLTQNAPALWVAQGAMTFVFYAGAALLLLIPGTPLSLHGQGFASFLCAGSPREYYVGMAALSMATGAAFLCLPTMTRIVARAANGTDPNLMASGLGLGLVLLAFLCGGPAGLAVFAVSAGIGILSLFAPQAHSPGLGLFLIPLAVGASDLTIALQVLSDIL